MKKNIKDIKQVSNYMYNILSKRINIQDYSDLNEEDETSDSNNSSNMLHWVQNGTLIVKIKNMKNNSMNHRSYHWMKF